MGYQIIYLLIINILGIISGLCFLGMKKVINPYKIRIKKNRYIVFKNYLISRIDNEDVNKLIQQSGIGITLYQYQIIRYVVFIIWSILYLVFYQLIESKFSLNQILMIVILFIVTSPKSYFLGKRTPFKYVIDICTHDYKNKLNIELYRCILQLKNIAITRKDISFSSDFLLEQLSKFTKRTKPIFNRMIALWSIGKKEEACNYFASVIDTKEAEQLSNLFRKLDNLFPNELYNQIVLLQEAMKKERETSKLVANENKSNLIYFIVIATSVVVLINFVIVVYYLETLHQMQFFQ